MNPKEVYNLAASQGTVTLVSHPKLNSNAVKFLLQIKDRKFYTLTPRQQDYLISIEQILTKEYNSKQVSLIALFGEFIN